MKRLIAAGFAIGALGAPNLALGAVIDVTTTADEAGTGPQCSLREAVLAAGGDAAVGGCAAGDAFDQIRLSRGATYPIAIPGRGENAGLTGDLDLSTANGGVRIEATGAGAAPVIDAGFLDRALDVSGDEALIVDGIRMTDGNVEATENGGTLRWLGAGTPGAFSAYDSSFERSFAALAGAIDLETEGPHLIEDTSITGNSAFDRGAIRALGPLTVTGSTVSGNGGGGIAAEDPGTNALVLTASTVSGNTIGADLSMGAVLAEGGAEVENSTISGNIGGFIGGIQANDSLEVRFSTVAGNGGPAADGRSTGGIDVQGTGAVSLDGVLVAGNYSGTALSNCNGPVDSDLHPNLEDGTSCQLQSGGPAPSLSGTDPQLAPLAANGGPTETRGLYPGSPALDAAGGCSPLAADQRGQPRQPGACDIGAFEGTVPRPVTPPSQSPPAAQKKKKKKKKCTKKEGKKTGKGKGKRCGKKKPKRRGLAAEPEVIGRSVQGRPIRAVRLGDPGAERVALVVGVIHGDERAGLRIVRRVKGMGADLEHSQVWVINSINPDGAHAHERRNAHGVDLNRNFPFRWRGGVPRSSGYYPGPAPASEPETKAVMAFVERIQPDLSIWYHQPWGAVLACRNRPPQAVRYAKLTGMRTSCRGKGLRGTAITWENATIAGSTAFVVELPAGRIGKRAARRNAAAAVDLAEDG